MVKKSFKISNNSLGLLLFAGLFIQFVVPQVGITSLSFLSTLIYLLVAIYLFII